jgi:phospholipase/carboxylesterase
MYTHTLDFVENGNRKNAERVVILLHGRGSTAEGILGLKNHLELGNAWLIAPQATQRTWYPYSFMHAVEANEPALSSALTVLDELVEQIEKEGFTKKQIFWLGFSQGACLALEYIATRAEAYGGVVAFTGGLIGQTLVASRYTKSLLATPILITSGDEDPHVPLARVYATRDQLQSQHALVHMEIYPDKPHSISPDETFLANKLIFNPKE